MRETTRGCLHMLIVSPRRPVVLSGIRDTCCIHLRLILHSNRRFIFYYILFHVWNKSITSFIHLAMQGYEFTSQPRGMCCQFIDHVFDWWSHVTTTSSRTANKIANCHWIVHHDGAKDMSKVHEPSHLVPHSQACRREASYVHVDSLWLVQQCEIEYRNHEDPSVRSADRGKLVHTANTTTSKKSSPISWMELLL